ncbi:2-dehydro-3-deoxygalactonokinase [Pseudoduganella sp. LjRoot289]|uniref:2-dehydro-3-deoxygalactonokinase n=1 Tax=Pseudoduganella sp. LjRoot289 TaxID=3342314 RepID=UPI003ED09227
MVSAAAAGAGADGEAQALAAAQLIGVDWGSSGLRAFLIGADGLALVERATAQGAATLAGADAYAAVLDETVGDWMRARPELPVIACGMVGSQYGWVDVPYAACPSGAPALASGMRRTPNGAAHVVPGLLQSGDGLPPDLMRGEETQIVGALQLRPELHEGACLVLPGTHSKWAQLRSGRVERFATHMTGELYAVLRQHSVLGRLMVDDAAFDEAAYCGGVEAARDFGHLGMSHQIFAARSLGVTGRMPHTALADYLSGLLIGHELRAGLAWRADAGLEQAPLALVGSPALCARYQLALQRYSGVQALTLDNTAPAGLLCLAQAAGLTAGVTQKEYA